MDIFNLLSLIGGLCLFLFGMKIMGDGLERRAGKGLKTLLGRLTDNRYKGFLTGLVVTAIIQSSSATTVMVVGFVNAGLMTLGQSVGVIMGANVGTTVTAWIISLGSISGESLLLQMLKPTSFTPVLALIGIAFLMFCRSDKKKDSGTVLLGFATLMFGMDAMSGAVSGLKDLAWFREMFVLFENPLLGILVGAVLTAIIQSSSASVGILQALSVTGQVSYRAAVPIIMGQSIGTCVTAMLSSIGAKKNARRAAVVHLLFNVIGTAVFLTLFTLVTTVAEVALVDTAATPLGIAVVLTGFKLLCTVLFLPMSHLFEKMACRLVREGNAREQTTELDDRLLSTPTIALEQCAKLTTKMCASVCEGMKDALDILRAYDKEKAARIRAIEGQADHYEDVLGTYLTKLSQHRITTEDSIKIAKLLKGIGDLERISDHSVNLLESAEEMCEKKIEMTPRAKQELEKICAAVSEILHLASIAFIQSDAVLACEVEPLEEVIDRLKDVLRNSHIERLQQGNCTVEAGFVWSDILTDLERVSDHCSNLAVCVIDAHGQAVGSHAFLYRLKHEDSAYTQKVEAYAQKYAL